MAIKKNTPSDEITDILKVTTGTFECCVVGTSPLILNRMSEKAKRELLMPKGRKNAIEKATSLKHMPVEEYRASAYTLKDDSRATYLALLSTAFKGALRSAALDMPGAKKAQIGRLTFVEGEMVGIYGVPKLFMTTVRSADMNKTPDVRTRPILPEWACHIRIQFVRPLINAQAVTNLLAAAGITIGVGDWRSQKGSGNYGQFALVSDTDATYKGIVKRGGRAVQQEAMAHPVCHNDETTKLLSWYDSEKERRKLRGVA